MNKQRGSEQKSGFQSTFGRNNPNQSFRQTVTSKRANSNSKVTETDQEAKTNNLKNPDRKTTGNVTLEGDNKSRAELPASSHKVEETDDEDKILKEAPKKRG